MASLEAFNRIGPLPPRDLSGRGPDLLSAASSAQNSGQAPAIVLPVAELLNVDKIYGQGEAQVKALDNLCLRVERGD
jgi:hypothetical protein